MIQNGWLQHNDVIVLDNAAVHTGGAATNLEEILWDTVVDGVPLQIVVLWLPTRSPELNPIELVFHILAQRVRKYQYGLGHDVLARAATIMDLMECELIVKCCRHCGYNL